MLKRGTGRARIRLSIFIGTAALALGVIAAGAWAITPDLVASDDFYSAPSYTIDQGEIPTLSNGGVNQHNVTAQQNGPDKRQLFASPTLNGGQQGAVNGTQYLAAGTYTFFCTIHPTTMQATLVVTSNGTPQARPSASLKLKTKTISKALKGLQVGINSSAKVDGAALTAKLGGATLGKTTASLFAGNQTVKLKLSKSGKSKLRKKNSAKVTVTADIPFGSPATAKAKLK